MDNLQRDIAAVARITAVPTILKVVSETTGLRLALVARVTEDSWTACATLDRMNFGLGVGDKLDVTTTLCSEVRSTQRPIVIEHASQDPDFCTHPTPILYHLESYMAFPIYRTNGEYFGNLCALDSAPALLRDDKTISMMTLFAEMISLQLTAEEEHTRDRAALIEARLTAHERERFVAVLAHDLRTPLTAVIGGADLLLMGQMTESQYDTVRQIGASGKRVARLVDDVLDFARGRFGEGIPIVREQIDDVGALIRQVVDEVTLAAPQRSIQLRGDDPGSARLDRSRVSQLFANLIVNAVEHSNDDEAVDVHIRSTPETIELTVHNGGEPIPAHNAQRLFLPFHRGDRVRSDRNQGLGLGLFIVAQVVQAHGGSISFTSTHEEGTTFSVILPRA